MLKRILAALLVLAAASAQAGTITVNSTSRSTTAGQDAAWVARKDRHNADLCASKALPASCTQAQFAAAGGEGAIYSGAQATQTYALDRIFELIEAVERQINDSRKADVASAWQTATEAQRAAAYAAACQALGKTADCK
jgi:hypothetical protein